VDQVTEERLGQVLWAWIERARANDQSLATGLEGLTAADVQELVRLFHTAEQVQQALAPEAEAPAVLPERLREAIEQRRRSQAPARTVSPPSRLPWNLWSRLPLAFSAAAGIAVGLLGATFLSAPPESLDHPPHAVPALSHSATVSYFPRLSSGSLPSDKRRAVFWHLSHCNACFDHFESTLPKNRDASRKGAPGVLAEAGIHSENSSDKLPGGS
jgi:hypothetical protein